MADFLQFQQMRLMIVAMGNAANNITWMRPLNANLFAWPDYNILPVDMANEIINTFSCCTFLIN
jgi:hypothetical protein